MCIRDRADAVQAVELVGRQAHGVHALEGDGDLAHGLGGVYVQVAVGPCPVSYTHLDVYKRQRWKD